MNADSAIVIVAVVTILVVIAALLNWELYTYEGSHSLACLPVLRYTGEPRRLTWAGHIGD